MPRDQKTHGFIPYQSGTNMFASQGGMPDPPGVGMFRHVTKDVDALNFT